MRRQICFFVSDFVQIQKWPVPTARESITGTGRNPNAPLRGEGFKMIDYLNQMVNLANGLTTLIATLFAFWVWRSRRDEKEDTST